MSEWRDIATAPKDGTAILVFSENWRPSLVDVTWWVQNLMTGRMSKHLNAPMVEDYWTNGRGSKLDCEPTHWMHLPAPPVIK